MLTQLSYYRALVESEESRKRDARVGAPDVTPDHN